LSVVDAVVVVVDDDDDDDDDDTVVVFGKEFSPNILSIEKFNCEDLFAIEFD